MEAVAVVDRRWRVWSPLDGWLRMTGLLRGTWESEALWRFMHPADHNRLRGLGEQMEHGDGFVELRLGAYGQWERCEVRTSRWTAGGASISVRRVPPRCAVVITTKTRYLHVSREAEEVLRATARELEGAPWSDRTHPVFHNRYQPTIDRTHRGHGGLCAMPCMVRVGDAWKPFEVWTEPYPRGLAFCQFQPMPERPAAPLRESTLPPLPLVVSA